MSDAAIAGFQSPTPVGSTTVDRSQSPRLNLVIVQLETRNLSQWGSSSIVIVSTWNSAFRTFNRRPCRGPELVFGSQASHSNLAGPSPPMPIFVLVGPIF